MNHLDMRLLEQAAAAAVYKPVRWNDDETAILMEGEQEPWNPLTDDGDALRLMVRLEIDPQFAADATWVKWSTGPTSTRLHSEPHDKDPYAATRRAIVRAAAEIGKGK